MNGEVLLDYNIRILREVWIDDIDLVVGYKWSMIEEHVIKNKLNAKIIYNHNWQKSAVHTLKAAFEWEEKDSLLIYWDTLLDKSLIQDIVWAPGEVTFISRMSKKVESETPIELFTNGMIDSWIFKIGKGMFHVFDDPQKVEKETADFLQKEYTSFSHANISGWVTLSVMIKLMALKSNNVDLVAVNGRYKDMDFFYQTDEYKKYPWKIYFTAYPLYRFLQKYNFISLLKKMKVLDIISKVGAVFK